MNSAQLIRWSTLHERRGRTGGLLASPFTLAILAGGALAALGRVAQRRPAPPRRATRGSQARSSRSRSRSCACRSTSTGAPTPRCSRSCRSREGRLLDAALWRCLRAALPRPRSPSRSARCLSCTPSTELSLRHAAIAGVLGLVAATLCPPWRSGRRRSSRSARVSDRRRCVSRPASIGHPQAAAETTQPPAPSSALLGALPGFAATGVDRRRVLLGGRWLVRSPPRPRRSCSRSSPVRASSAIVLAPRASARDDGAILRDVSALDRQRLATLEIQAARRASSARSRGMIGDAALPYRKDARLMRRRYPMAFALGALVFLVLVIVGLAQPDDPTPWLVATLVGAACLRARRSPAACARADRAAAPLADAADPRRGDPARKARVARWLVDDLRRGPRSPRFAATDLPSRGSDPARRRHAGRPRCRRAAQILITRHLHAMLRWPLFAALAACATPSPPAIGSLEPRSAHARTANRAAV